MTNYKEFFRFPILLSDGRVEQNKQELSPLEIQDIDVIVGDAMVHCDDVVVYIEDGWIPRAAELKKAVEGTFTACEVGWKNAGIFQVGESRKQFIDRHTAFMKKIQTQREAEASAELKERLNGPQPMMLMLLDKETEAEIRNQINNQQNDEQDIQEGL